MIDWIVFIECKPGWLMVPMNRKKCYTSGNGKVTYEEAVEKCKLIFGGKLMAPESEKENIYFLQGKTHTCAKGG